MIGFERTKQSIQGHGVTITSWFDPEKQVYRASAPAYLHVIHEWPATSLQGRTREQASRTSRCSSATTSRVLPPVSEVVRDIAVLVIPGRSQDAGCGTAGHRCAWCVAHEQAGRCAGKSRWQANGQETIS